MHKIRFVHDMTFYNKNTNQNLWFIQLFVFLCHQNNLSQTSMLHSKFVGSDIENDLND